MSADTFRSFLDASKLRTPNASRDRSPLNCDIFYNVYSFLDFEETSLVGPYLPYPSNTILFKGSTQVLVR